MPTVQSVCQFLDEFAPRDLAEDWDNVGLLVGDSASSVKKIMTCLTVTPASASEAVEKDVDIIVTHHPLPFRPLKRLTADTTSGRMLLDLIAAGISVFSPHTAFDSAAAGINQRLADGLGLKGVRPLVPLETNEDGLGSGRFGRFSKRKRLSKIVEKLKEFLKIEGMHLVGSPDVMIRTAAVACGSAGQFISQARRHGCDLLVTGETNFHTCLEAEATGIALLLPGHYASERFAVEHLADILSDEFSGVTVWASKRESDPLQWI